MSIKVKVVIEIEDDGRFIAEAVDYPGAMAYGITKEEALEKVREVVKRVIEDRRADDEAT